MEPMLICDTNLTQWKENIDTSSPVWRIWSIISNANNYKSNRLAGRIVCVRIVLKVESSCTFKELSLHVIVSEGVKPSNENVCQVQVDYIKNTILFCGIIDYK